MLIKIKKGLCIPIDGTPEQKISNAVDVASVAVVAADVVGLRPSVSVSEGDRVLAGQTLFVSKQNPEVHFTAPGTGIVTAINRGARRALQSIVIRLDGDDAKPFERFDSRQLSTLDADKVREILLDSGLWTTLRTRPFSHIPRPGTSPAAIFVTAIDTNPLAADPAVVIGDAEDDFRHGLQVLSRLGAPKNYVCTAPGSGIPVPDDEAFRQVEFEGPHPAGLVGTHIHFLEPVGPSKTVWHVGYQHVIAIGRLFTTGKLPCEKIIALGGPKALRPRLLRTRVGASTADLLRDETAAGWLRIISGSVLSGHQASGPLAFVGRFHNQVSVLGEGSPREFLAWMRPGLSKYSAIRAYASHIFRKNDFPMTTTQNGSLRAMVSIGTFEKVMPLDILPTPLLKALLVEDTDRARELGCLELDEEDLALCSFVCNGKYEYGPFLRMNLNEIDANG
ncbi:MAG: Na(+)-translocating NADH-quinone reductase subunit A [Gammaproteobacteria bacterium]|nr:Na(+)-translocating NADH-quinone reductase subunit A [Gammaproteobacteria bacterium]NNC77359.1 Na(+)-translocating NADH-quinone reductase subunit A [Woeseiaceae bacterium]